MTVAAAPRYLSAEYVGSVRDRLVRPLRPHAELDAPNVNNRKTAGTDASIRQFTRLNSLEPLLLCGSCERR
jgi:hypothetical protein